MKKLLALLLCILMAAAMLSSVSAADYVLDYDFEEDAEGDFLALDNTIRVYPKQFEIGVEEMDNNMCLKVDRQNYKKDAGDSDCFVNLLDGGTTKTYGLGSTFVLSYDAYFEKIDEKGSIWEVGGLRTEKNLQSSVYVIGNKICSSEIIWEEFKNGAPLGSDWIQSLDSPTWYWKGEGDVFATIETGRWYNFAIAYDMTNKCSSVYLDGVLIVDSLDWLNEETASEANLIRIGWKPQVIADYDATVYIDNIKAYSGEKPENAVAETTAPETTAAPVTEAVTNAAPATAAVTEAAPAPSAPAAATADAAVILVAVSAIAASGAIVFRKRH